MWQTRGFTLLEMLLSVSILALIAGISLPVFVSLQTRQDVVLAEKSAAEALRRAQQYSATGRLDSGWGVHFQAGSITVYKGTSYAARDAGYDEADVLPPTITMSYLGDVNFSKLYAIPDVSGVQTFSSQVDATTQTLTLNAKGMVDY